jgi:protein-tyrosine-phosphatase
MAELGYDLAQHDSKALSDLSEFEFDVVVAMGCGDACPMVRCKRREDWESPDPRSLPVAEFRAVRDEIEQKVKDLLRVESINPDPPCE